MKAGFIGLGHMGQPMARNLLKAGHELIVYNRTPGRAEELAQEGVRIALTPAEACVGGVVMTMLADDPALEACVFGGAGILGALPAGGVHVSLSTISTAFARRLAEVHGEKEQLYMSAPVFGRPEAAAAARLVVVAAGPGNALERCRPLLEAISRKVFVVGPEAPAANTVKLAGNFLIAAMLESLAEAFVLVQKSGVQPAQFLEIANGSLFQSPLYENYGKIIVEKRYEPAGFKLLLGLKDVRLALAAAEAVAVPMPLASLLRDHMLALVAEGRGEIDWAGVAQIAARNAGLKT